MVTVETSGPRSGLPSHPHPKTIRRPGSTSTNVPAATSPTITVQRYWPPARRSTRADTVCQRRNRSGSVISADASSVDTGSRTVFSASIRVLLGGLGQSSIESAGGRIGDQEIELSRPEALKLLAQLSHSGRHLAVGASPAVLAANYQPHLG